MNDALYQEMQHPVTGVSVKSRKVRRPLAMGYRRHKECFTGTDAVSWLLAHLRDGTRAQASLVLQGWLEGNRIRRVGEHSSKSGAEVDDRNALFQFTSSSASGGLSSAGAEGRLPRAKVGEGALSSPARLEAALALLFPGRRVDCFARVSAARGKKKREREGHFLALIGGTGTPTLQLGRLEGEVKQRMLIVSIESILKNSIAIVGSAGGERVAAESSGRDVGRRKRRSSISSWSSTRKRTRGISI